MLPGCCRVVPGPSQQAAPGVGEAVVPPHAVLGLVAGDDELTLEQVHGHSKGPNSWHIENLLVALPTLGRAEDLQFIIL